MKSHRTSKQKRRSYAKHKRKDQALVDAGNMIQDWAAWRLNYWRGNPLDYPHSSTEGRMVRDGGVIISGGALARSKVPQGVMMHPKIQVVDRAIGQMWQDGHKILVDVITWEYLSAGDKSAIKAVFSSKYNRHQNDYCKVLDIAKAYVLGHIGGYRDNEHRE